MKNKFIRIKSKQCIFKFIKNKVIKCTIDLYGNEMIIAGEEEYT